MSTRQDPPASPSGRDLLRLDNQLCFALYSTSLTMTKLYKPVLARLGLTYPQYLVMLALWESAPQTVSDLGARLFLDSGTLTPLLKRMQASGWITRERDVADERRVVVRLTDDGRALRERAMTIPREVASAARCSPSEIIDLTRRLQRLRAAIADGPAPSHAAAR